VRDREQYQIEQENKKDKHHLILRRKEGGVWPGSNADLLVFERTDHGVTPAQLMATFKKIEVMLKSSKPVFKCDILSFEEHGTQGETFETYAAHFKVPFMEPRILLNTKYWMP
jgi:hypothetical protein